MNQAIGNICILNYSRVEFWNWVPKGTNQIFPIMNLVFQIVNMLTEQKNGITKEVLKS